MTQVHSDTGTSGVRAYMVLAKKLSNEKNEIKCALKEKNRRKMKCQ